MSARILDITAAQYHADPCEEPSLSSSLAKLLAEKSPAHAWLAHPRLGGGAGGGGSKAMDRGTFVHSMLLGKGAGVVEIPYDNYRKPVAQKLRDEARDAGRVPMLTRQVDELRGAADTIRERMAACGVRLTGASEVAITWRESVFMHDATVQCRAMLDHVLFNEGVIYDIKTCESADLAFIERQIYNMGYDIQSAAYRSALRALRPDLAGHERFVFVFIETEPPYAVTPVRLSGEYREIGQRRWDRAVQTWHRCLTSNTWPTYADRVVEIYPPSWAMAREAS